MILGFGILFIINGLLGIFFNLENIPGLGGLSPIYYDDITYGTIIASIEIIIGLILSIYAIKRMNKFKVIEYSKCPECKESYTYSNLKDGICSKCKIKTIDIKEYYKNKSSQKYIWEDLD